MKDSGLPIKKKPKIDKENLIRLSLLALFAAILSIVIIRDEEFSLKIATGNFLLTAFLLILLYKDLMRYKAKTYMNYSIIALIGVLLLGNFLIGRVIYYILTGFIAWLGNINPELSMYAIPLATGSMLTALLIDIHTAIVFSVISALLAGIWLGNPFYSVFSFVAGLTSAFGVIRCKKRSAIWKAGFFVGIASLLTSSIILYAQGRFLTMDTPVGIGLAFLNGLIVTTLVSAFLPLLEYIFKLTTDISLLELLDLNQPLMRNLLIEAPGTYHHSIIVGNLAETAAEAVGVNPLLARVSAYYHDIGKIKMPDYFIENQTAPASRHDRLAPHMSSLILITHVKEGVELAKQHKLPRSVIDIIQQHHGTSVIAYFYQKAKAQSEYGGPLPSESDFRYPGPKPQTRVAALVLMADAVEAASRTLEEPTPMRISVLVDRIINHFFLDGQLDDCELTLKDIREIKDHFVYLLTGMFHKRVSYPGFEIKDGSIDKKSTELQTSKPHKNKKGSFEHPLPVKVSKG